MTVNIVVMKAVNDENERIANEVNAVLTEKGILGINIMSSPGSGKTSLLEATLKTIGHDHRFAVIEGDVFTAIDAERISRYNAHVIQINTEGSCHMTAHMVKKLLSDLPLDDLDFLIIENIGNLICPASFRLGEHYSVACISTTEGADKVEKYPKLFSVSNLNLITKADLAKHVDFDIETVKSGLIELNPDAPVFITSASTGAGIDFWCNWLIDHSHHIKANQFK